MLLWNPSADLGSAPGSTRPHLRPTHLGGYFLVQPLTQREISEIRFTDCRRLEKYQLASPS